MNRLVLSLTFLVLLFWAVSRPLPLRAGSGDGSAISFRGFTSLQSEDTTFETDDVLTLELWFRTTKTNGLNLFGHEDPGSSNNFAQLRMNGDNQRVRFVVSDQANNIAAVDSPTALNDGLWHHAAGVRDGATMQLYIDGQLVSETTNNTSITDLNINGPIKIGRWRLFSGATLLEVDEARLWHTARTATEIDSNRFSSIPVDATGLVAYWPMAAGSGTTVADATGNGNDLTFVDSGSASPLWAGRIWAGGASAFSSSVASGAGVDANAIVVAEGDDITLFPTQLEYGVLTSNLPATVMSRWAQYFLLSVNDANGSVRGGGTIDLTFDILDAGGSGNFDASETYSLLFRNNEIAGGAFGIVPVQGTVVNGDQVIFTVDSNNFGPGIKQITIGTNMDFTAVAMREQSSLKNGPFATLVVFAALVGLSGVVFGRKRLTP